MGKEKNKGETFFTRARVCLAVECSSEASELSNVLVGGWGRQFCLMTQVPDMRRERFYQILATLRFAK